MLPAILASWIGASPVITITGATHIFTTLNTTKQILKKLNHFFSPFLFIKNIFTSTMWTTRL